jgi:hypothetical protein
LRVASRVRYQNNPSDQKSIWRFQAFLIFQFWGEAEISGIVTLLYMRIRVSCLWFMWAYLEFLENSLGIISGTWRSVLLFYTRDFHESSCFSGSLQDFQIFFEPNGYFSFTTTTWGSVNVKFWHNLKSNLFEGFLFLNLSHFHTGWLIFEGLATKVNLNHI